MAISIKEIHVKTTVERSIRQNSIEDNDIQRLKKSILRELKEDMQKDKIKRKER